MNLRQRFRSIRARLTLWYMLLLAIVLVVFSGSLYFALSAALYDNLDNLLRSTASLVTNALDVDAEEGHLDPDIENTAVWSESHAGEYFWRVLDPAGQVVAEQGAGNMGDPPVEPAAVSAALTGRDVFETVHLQETGLRVYTWPLVHQNRTVAVVQLGISLDDVQDTLTAFRWILVLAVPATLALASTGGLLLSNRALSPVDRITRAAQSIGARDLSQRLNLDLPDDELGRLAHTFDAMIARLDAAFRRQRRFTADASHELRTPLTIIKGDLGVALNRPRDADYYHHTLVEIDEEVDKMNRLVERLLALARADADGLALNRQVVDLSILLTDLVEQTRPLAESKGLALDAQIAADLSVQSDPDAVTEVVLNLLDNAIKYTSTGRIRLHARRGGDASNGVHISISDTGAGIPAEHLEQIFDRFHRVDKARSRELGGSGLGLAIARDLARALGGEITVHSVPGEGSTFTLLLPLQ